MTEEQLKDGEVLLKTIKTTESQLENLTILQGKIQTQVRGKDNKYDDGLYSLNVSEHRDGSGDSADLCRYGGNMELLEVIIAELERQLDAYEFHFEKL